MNPEFYYKNFKALSLIYDEIIFWQPVETRIEEFGGDVSEFIALLDPVDRDGKGSIPIRAAGRELFYDYSWRSQSEPDDFRRTLSPSFLKEISEHKLIAPYANRNRAVQVVTDLLAGEDGPYWDSIAKDIFDVVDITKRPDVHTRMHRIAEQQKIPPEHAHFQEFFQDQFARIDLISQGVPIRKLATDSKHWQGYQMISDRYRDQDQSSVTGIESFTDRYVGKFAIDGQVAEFLDIFYGASELSPSEILAWKTAHAELLRRYFDEQTSAIEIGALIPESLKIAQQTSDLERELPLNLAKLATDILKACGAEFDGAATIADQISYILGCLEDNLPIGDFVLNVSSYAKDVRKSVVRSYAKLPSQIVRKNAALTYAPLFLDTHLDAETLAHRLVD